MLPAPLVSLSSQDWGAGKGSFLTAVFTLGEWAGTFPGLRWQGSSSCSQPSLCVGAGRGGHHEQTITASLRAFQGPWRLALLLGAGPSALGQTPGPQCGPCPLPQQGCGNPVRRLGLLRGSPTTPASVPPVSQDTCRPPPWHTRPGRVCTHPSPHPRNGQGRRSQRMPRLAGLASGWVGVSKCLVGGRVSSSQPRKVSTWCQLAEQ